MDRAIEMTEIISAVDRADAAGLRALLARNPALARARIPIEQSHSQTLLHRAIPSDGETMTQDHLDTLQVLLDCRAETDLPGWGANNGECTPLTMAAWGGHAPLVRLLLQHGACPDGCPAQIARGHRPIDTAADHGHVEAVQALIEHGARYTFSHLLKAGLTAQVERFLESDSTAASRTLEDGSPPLHLAVQSAHSEPLIDLLAAHGADMHAEDSRGRTAVHVAIENQRLQTARSLLDRGVRYDLFAAAGLGDTAFVSHLLGRDGSLALAEQTDGVTALHFAAWAGDREIVELLLAHGAKVSPQAQRFWACLTPLHIALQGGHRETSALLLDHGADVNAFAAVPSRYWPTPLHVAARWGTLEDVRRLLDYGADPNFGPPVEDSMGASGLAWTVLTGQEQIVRLLLDFGLDLRHPNHRDALHVAAEHGQTKIVRLLLDNGMDPNLRDACGETPGERAARFGKYEVAECLDSRNS